MCHIPFEICIAILKRRDSLEVVAINGRIILNNIELYFEELVLEYVDRISLALNQDQ